MRSWLLLGTLFTVTLASGAGALAACGIQTNGTGEAPDGSVVDAELETGLDAELDAEADAAQRVGDAGRGDAGQPDSSDACTGVVCAGQCLDARDCRSCPGAPLLCRSGACVSSCTGCQDPQGIATPIECFACDSNHANPIGTCQYDDAGSYCLSGNYLGQYQGGPGYQCACSDAGACPGATQVCVPLGNYKSDFCLTCGETTLAPIDGQPCMGGGTCQASAAVCQ